jgi:hypothetical protein
MRFAEVGENVVHSEKMNVNMYTLAATEALVSQYPKVSGGTPYLSMMLIRRFKSCSLLKDFKDDFCFSGTSILVCSMEKISCIAVAESGVNERSWLHSRIAKGSSNCKCGRNLYP